MPIFEIYYEVYPEHTLILRGIFKLIGYTIFRLITLPILIDLEKYDILLLFNIFFSLLNKVKVIRDDYNYCFLRTKWGYMLTCGYGGAKLAKQPGKNSALVSWVLSFGLSSLHV